MVSSVLKPTGLDSIDGKRPDGMVNFTWKNGMCLAWDVTCVDTVAITYIVHTTAVPGWAADEAERDKGKKYANLEGRFYFRGKWST